MTPEDYGMTEEDFIIALHDDWCNQDKILNAEDLAWLATNRPGLIAEWEALWVRENRPPTREEIVEKMNYRAGNWEDVDFERGMNAGVRELLAEALTKPRDTDYATYFDAGRYLVNYTNVPAPDMLPGAEVQEWWGVQSGKAAALRWLTEQNRDFADDLFPCLDDVRIVWPDSL